MKHLSLITSLLIMASTASAQAPEATCLPDTPEARTWEVRGVYLHGHHYGSNYRSDIQGLWNLEYRNRHAVEAFAEAKGYRIAVPVASKNGFRSWHNLSNAQIKKLAEQACGAPIQPNATLIGFSNGGYTANAWACARNKLGFSEFLVRGAPTSARKRCGNAKRFDPHVALNYTFLANALGGATRFAEVRRQTPRTEHNYVPEIGGSVSL